MRKLKHLVLFLMISIVLVAHSGRIDKNGGHTNKKTGKYHYHNKKILTQESVKTTVKVENKLIGQVNYVSDGDTFHLLVDGVKYKIRLYGVDTPEKLQEHGLEAKEFTNKLISRKEVTVLVKDKDRYGRIVGEVYIGSINLNLELLRSGNAWWYEYYAKNETEYRAAQEAARASKLGLWSSVNPIAPWKWRKLNK